MRLLSFPGLTALAVVLTIAGQFDAVAAQKYWCGKPYTPKNPQKRTVNLLRRQNSDDDEAVLPPTSDPVPKIPNLSEGYAAMARMQPYLDDEEEASLVVDVAKTDGKVSVDIALEDGTQLLEKTEIEVSDWTVEVPFSIKDVKPQTEPHNLKVSFYLGDDDKATHETTVKLYRLQKGPVTIKIDRLYGTTIASNDKIVFPVGPYVDFNWLAQGDIKSNLQTLKSMGFNIINPDPTYTDLNFVEEMLTAADEIGDFYFQYSFRYSFTDINSVVSQVKRFKKHPSVLTWYTADEPDGEQWTDASAIRTVYAAIKKEDPYRPISLVLNCELTAAYYADVTDILGVDVYPVGVDVSHCTETDDVCGCDNCLGSATKDIPKRTAKVRSDLALIGRQAVPLWKVLQAFSDPPTWWERMPTKEEYRFMAWQAVTLGYKSIMHWKYPSVPDKSLEATVNSVAQETHKYSPYFLESLQLPASHLDIRENFYAGAWLSADRQSFFAVVANGNDGKGNGTFSLTIEDLKDVDSLEGTAVTSGGESDVTIKNGVLSGTSGSLGVNIYVFGKVPEATRQPGDSSGPGGAGPAGEKSSANNQSIGGGANAVSLAASSVFALTAAISLMNLFF